MKTTINPIVSTLADSGLSFVPRVTISHDDGGLEFNDFGLSLNQRQCLIMLGAIRQRIMWAPRELAVGMVLCDSKDFEHGNPTKDFPWETSNFTKPDDFADGDHLDCGACMFSHWTKDETARRGSRPALCTESVIVPMLIASNPDVKYNGAENLDIEYKVGAMSFQKSSIKPIADHMRSFRLSSMPAYSMTTTMALNTNLGSGFKYSVPSLAKQSIVNEEKYPLLSTILREVRDVVTKPTPARSSEGGFLSVGITDAPTSGYTGTFFS